jgi:hypothetical protein
MPVAQSRLMADTTKRPCGGLLLRVWCDEHDSGPQLRAHLLEYHEGGPPTDHEPTYALGVEAITGVVRRWVAERAEGCGDQ